MKAGMRVAVAGTNVDDFMSSTPFKSLARALTEVGGSLTSLNLPASNESAVDIAIFMAISGKPVERLLAAHPDVEPWVILAENEVVWPRNWDVRLHEQFTHIFTWNDAFVDGRRYHKLNQPYEPAQLPPRSLDEKTGFCTLIAANKIAHHPRELYSERVRLIRWYERNHPDLFDLYGHWWDSPAKHVAGPPRGLDKAAATVARWKATLRPFASWQGAIDDKISTLSRYRFAIAYENATGDPGYVSEKLFDCMAAGTVGVYWGADNITDYVPETCFVDRSAFDSTAELHDFLIEMDDATYQCKLDACRQFLASADMDAFSTCVWVRTLMTQIKASAVRYEARA